MRGLRRKPVSLFTKVILVASSIFQEVAPTVYSVHENKNTFSCTSASPERTCEADETTRSFDRVPHSCRLVMAESSIPNSGWGVFVMAEKPRGVPVSFGDVVIHVADINATYAHGLRRLLQDYAWDSQETGGFYEGRKVFSVIPGMGMLANGLGGASGPNILPFVPQVSEGDLFRTSSPGAGAITHYHNYTFFIQRIIPEGGEVFANYGRDWFQERSSSLNGIDEQTTKRSVEWLKENAWCLDNLKPGTSEKGDAGRGAFATRLLKKGSVIAPVPVAVIDSRSSLFLSTRTRPRTRAEKLQLDDDSDVVVDGYQLLLNYCLGHSNSSLLLYPYSPLVNLVNNDRQNYNAKLQWSQHSIDNGWIDKTLAEIRLSNKTSLLLELVATQDIAPGQEVFIDYGKAWQEAWDRHVASWQPVEDADLYTTAHVMEDVVASRLRTQHEQATHPYPENLFTSCFYRYSERRDKVVVGTAGEASVFEWTFSPRIFELRNLRPCTVLARDEVQSGKGTTYLFTVLIRNRYGLTLEERVPMGEMHIVTKVPRQAIRFSDKIYTTDQHLENAFRHEIHIEDFPSQWMDRQG